MLAFEYLAIGTTGVAAIIDIKTRRIPNWLNLTVIAAGLIGSFCLTGWGGALASTKGLLVGIGVFLLPFILGGMGGGDVKLMGAVGALTGVAFIIETALLAALWGGVMALVAILIRKRTAVLKRFGTGIKLFMLTGGQAGMDFMAPQKDGDKSTKLYVPYGVAIFLGVVTAHSVNLKIFG